MKQNPFFKLFLAVAIFVLPVFVFPTVIFAQETKPTAATEEKGNIAPAEMPHNYLAEISEFAKQEGLQFNDSELQQIIDMFENNMDFAKRVLISTKEVVEGKNIVDIAQTMQLPEIPADSSLTPYQTRVWYSWQKSLIGSKVDRSKGLESAAREALSRRNLIRTKARTAMKDTDIADFLNAKELNMTWEQAYAKYTGDYEAIIGASMRGRGGVDVLFKIPK
jgi:hypothetical protein